MEEEINAKAERSKARLVTGGESFETTNLFRK